MKHSTGEGVGRNAKGVNPLWPRDAYGRGQAAREAEAYTDDEEREAVIGLLGVGRDGTC
jgi:hypothetical protein